MTVTPEERQGWWRDPVVAEVRRVREALFAAAGHDIREFCRRLRERQARSGHRVVTRAPRPEPDTPADAGGATRSPTSDEHLRDALAAEVPEPGRRLYRVRMGRGHRSRCTRPHRGPGPDVPNEPTGPYASFLPPALDVSPDVDDPPLRAVVFVTEGTPKGTDRSGQEYVDPLLVLSGREYGTLSFEDLHWRICDALRGDRPRLVAESWGPDGRRRLHFEDGSTWERRS